MARLSNWADGPFELVPSPRAKGITDPKFFVANDMAVAHNIYIRGLNAIYRQADHVTAKEDKDDFLLFCKIWIETVGHHHDFEEEVFFPQIEDQTGVKGLMNTNVEQHHAFHVKLEAFEEYLRDTTADTYDAKKVKELIDGFGSLLVTHLHEEIKTLSDLQQYDKDGSITLKAYQALEKKLASGSSWTRHYPFMFGCRDVTFENSANKEWPPVPFFVPLIISWHSSRKLSRVWRFLPSDFYGNPRAMPFAS